MKKGRERADRGDEERKREREGRERVRWHFVHLISFDRTLFPHLP